MGDDFPDPKRPNVKNAETVDDLLPYARKIVNRPGTRNINLTTGYGMVDEGDRVLIAVRSLHNELIVKSLVEAFREKGIEVDIISVDIGPDMERTEAMDVDLAITDPENSAGEQDTYSEFLGRFRWVEDLAEERGYDLLVQSTAGPVREKAHREGTPYYMERIPWQSPETFVGEGTHYPQELLRLIAQKTQELILTYGPGSDVRITDPEGTDLTFTLWEDYFENSPAGTGLSEDIWEKYYDDLDWPMRAVVRPANHVAGRPFSPLIEKENATGVVASTLGHHSKPYPRLKFHLEDGSVTKIEGGGEKGDKMRELYERTQDIHYPDHPDTGLFWFWECSIGTNPKVHRAKNFLMKSGPGMVTERLRSGIIHIGIGTRSDSYSEDWARENDLVYGHIDHHLNFPTYEIDTGDETITVIDKGHLTTLDDPEVRETAAEYGDPDELLTESWIPVLPGVNAEGNYDDYAKNPSKHISKNL